MAKATIKPSTTKDAISAGVSEFAEGIKAISQDMAANEKAAEIQEEKSKEEQLVNFKLSKDKYEEYKKMFGSAGYSFSKGVRMVLDYIYAEIKDGSLEIRESGIKQTLAARVGR